VSYYQITPGINDMVYMRLEVGGRGSNDRPTDLEAPLKARKWSINMGCGSGVGVLRGGGKVAVVGGRSGSFSPRAGYEGRRGAMRDSGMRSTKGSKLYSRW
jgi:hypothetical protein